MPEVVFPLEPDPSAESVARIAKKSHMRIMPSREVVRKYSPQEEKRASVILLK
jgi:hypothetical protein